MFSYHKEPRNAKGETHSPPQEISFDAKNFVQHGVEHAVPGGCFGLHFYPEQADGDTHERYGRKEEGVEVGLTKNDEAIRSEFFRKFRKTIAAIVKALFIGNTPQKRKGGDKNNSNPARL